MTVDREQISMDAALIVNAPYHYGDTMNVMPAIRVADHCLALLAELEQAEKDRDDLSELIEAADFYPDAASAELAVLRAEARLAKVPALVEALRRIHEAAEWQIGGKEAMHVDRVFILCRDALAVWESE